MGDTYLRISARRLDEKGRCCGRKPLVYKRPEHHLFCCRCCAEFSPDGIQRPNWAWLRTDDGFVSSHPDNGRHDYIVAASRPSQEPGGRDG